MKHQFALRVFYEDTDFAGIVYYANYLKFIERARSTMVREAGIDQKLMKTSLGVVFAVRHVEAQYYLPAVLDDELTVATKLRQMTGAKLVFAQDVYRRDQLLFSSVITVACLNTQGRATRIPADALSKMRLFAG